MSIKEYADYDALGLAELLRKKEVLPIELVEEAIARIEKHNATLNAVIHPAFDFARAMARRLEDASLPGPLHGVPFLLKDILGFCEGLPVTSGSRLLQGQRASHDSELVRRFRAAGLVFLGRTNAPEFGILPTTEPAAYGATRNPWHLEHSPGGSSGGSAAAVAAGIVPAAHANDGGGSIRIPASCCGLVGMKPTRARNSLGPDFGDLMSGLICEHVVTRSVRDSAAILDATHGYAPGDPYCAPPVERPFLSEVAREPEPLRIAYARRGLDQASLHPDCVAAVEAAAKLCESLGHSVEEAAPSLDAQGFIGAFMGIWASGLAASIDTVALARGRPPAEEELEGLTWGLYERGREVSAVDYQMAVGLLQLGTRAIADFHRDYDLWLTPTLGAPPLRNGVIDVQERDPATAFAPILEYCPFTAIHNATGQPAVSLPLYWNEEGLPIGVMFSGRFGEEGTLFRLAAQLERAQPWGQRRPGIWD